MKPAFVGPVHSLHVRFTSNPLPAFTEPVTEIAFLTLASPQCKPDVLEMLNKSSTLMNRGMVSCGETVEQENLIVVVRGWSSLAVSVILLLIDFGLRVPMDWYLSRRWLNNNMDMRTLRSTSLR
jgi:hypothetical protein